MEKSSQPDLFIDGVVGSQVDAFAWVEQPHVRRVEGNDLDRFDTAWMWLVEEMASGPSDFQRDCFARYALANGYDDSIVWMEVAC